MGEAFNLTASNQPNVLKDTFKIKLQEIVDAEAAEVAED